MTTGRINQVTTLHMCECKSPHTLHRVLVLRVLSTVGVRYKASKAPKLYVTPQQADTFHRSVLAYRKPASETPCFPISQVSGTALPVQRTEIVAFGEDYQQPAAPQRCAQSRRIPEWLVANRFGHRQVIHILQHYKHTSQKDGARFARVSSRTSGTQPHPATPYPSQYILIDRRIYDSVQEWPVNPLGGLTKRGPRSAPQLTGVITNRPTF